MRLHGFNLPLITTLMRANLPPETAPHLGRPLRLSLRGSEGGGSREIRLEGAVAALSRQRVAGPVTLPICSTSSQDARGYPPSDRGGPGLDIDSAG